MANDNALNRDLFNRGPAEEVATIPLAEEQVSITKREVEHERVQVHVRVDERHEVVTEQLLRDDVEIERVPRNVPLSELPNVRLEGSTTIIPVFEEVLVVEKRLMLVEEIHVRRRSGTEERQIPVTLRREEARIERSDALDQNSDSTVQGEVRS
jgi:uncharacterized protein (TIGR02271 family)